MNVEVFINEQPVAKVEVTESDAYRVAERLYHEYRIGVLQMRGVNCGVCITGVQSKMNRADFLKEPFS